MHGAIRPEIKQPLALPTVGIRVCVFTVRITWDIRRSRTETSRRGDARAKPAPALRNNVYLLSYFEDQGFIEASLGGKLTAGEMDVFSEELCSLAGAFEGRPYQLLLDYSKARGMSSEILGRLSEIRDKCLELGAIKIVSVTTSDADMERETAYRLQYVLEGTEAFVLDPAYARFESPASQTAAKYLAA